MSSSPLSGPRNRYFALPWALLGAAIAGCATNVVDDSGTILPTTADSGNYTFEGGSWLGEDDAGGQSGDDGSTPPQPPPPGSDAGNQGDSGPPPPPPDAGSDTGSGAVKPAPGEVLITEIMYDPSGTEPDQEWMELYNTTNGDRLLTGLTLADGANRTHTLGTLTIAPGAYIVLVRNKTAATAAGIATIAYEYGAGQSASTGIILANGSTGGIALKDGATDIARAMYGAWNLATSGTSIQLKSTAGGEATTAAGWCKSATAWTGGTDKGTPALAGDCP
jgi:hypothetical protein